MKLKWKVQAAPTGRYRSFSSRGWPMADLPSGDCAVALYCKDDYCPMNVRSGHHAEIKICVADYRTKEGEGTFNWRTLKPHAKTLEQAKTLAQEFVDTHPEVFTHSKSN